MSNTFTAIDLSQIPAPTVVEALDFESILAAMTDDLKARDSTFTALVESDPAFKILEVAAYRELLLRQRVNDAARAVMLAYATGSDLDHIGALFGVARLTETVNHEMLVITGALSPDVTGKFKRAPDVIGYPAYSTDGRGLPWTDAAITPGRWIKIEVDGVWRIYVYQDGGLLAESWYSADFYTEVPPSPAGLDWSEGGTVGEASGVPVMAIQPGEIETIVEDDASFRRRIQLALEGFSTAGPEGAYVFHALSASARVADVSATSPAPGEVLITVLGKLGDGEADSSLLGDVYDALSADEIRPLTDSVSVESAEIIGYSVDATLVLYSGPDAGLVLARARAAAKAYVQSMHRLGHDISRSGIYAALHQPGVQRVILTHPAADIEVSPLQAAYCLTTTVTISGTDE